jgi:hypothetical protein
MGSRRVQLVSPAELGFCGTWSFHLASLSLLAVYGVHGCSSVTSRFMVTRQDLEGKIFLQVIADISAQHLGFQVYC